MGDVRVDVFLHHFAHQARQRTARGGDLVQNIGTSLFGFQSTLDPLKLSTDATHTSEEFRFSLTV